MFYPIFKFFTRTILEGQTIYLIIDSYSSHINKISKQTAESLNIKLYFILSHFTDLLQPLDIAIFAPLKSKANSIIRRLLLQSDFKTIGIKMSLRFLQESWNELSESALANAWN